MDSHSKKKAKSDLFVLQKAEVLQVLCRKTTKLIEIVCHNYEVMGWLVRREES
jgi:hypothetical protein